MRSNTVQRISVGIAGVAGVCAIASCSALSSAGGSTSQPSQPSPSAPPSSQSAYASAPAPEPDGGTAATPDQPTSKATPRCTGNDLSASIGTVKGARGGGQVQVPLTFTNNSAHSCDLHGVPGVDLIGPQDPNGSVYHLPRTDNGVKVNDVSPGSTATAMITVLSPSDDSASWTPKKLETIPPGQTQPLIVAWPANLPVLRQDAATHPGTYVNGFLSD